MPTTTGDLSGVPVYSHTGICLCPCAHALYSAYCRVLMCACVRVCVAAEMAEQDAAEAGDDVDDPNGIDGADDEDEKVEDSKQAILANFNASIPKEMYVFWYIRHTYTYTHACIFIVMSCAFACMETSPRVH